MGKSSGQTIGYKYYMPLHFVSGISKGATTEGIAVRDCLFEVRVGDRVAWNGAIYDNGAITIDAPDLFGGDEKEGGISGTLEVMFGGPAQGVSAYLSVQQGPPQSAHRGLFSLVWQNGQVCSNNPYLKPWAFARRRITGGWHGECWYPAKAPITLEGGGDVPIPAEEGTYRWMYTTGTPFNVPSPDGIDWSEGPSVANAFGSGSTMILFGETLVATTNSGATKFAPWTSPGVWTDGGNAGSVTAILSPRLTVINGRLWSARGTSGYAFTDSPGGPWTLNSSRSTVIAGNASYVVRWNGFTSDYTFKRSVDNGDTFSDGLAVYKSGNPADADYATYINAGAASEARIAFGGNDYHGNPLVFWSDDGFLTKGVSTMPVGLSTSVRELRYIGGTEWLAFCSGASNVPLLRSTNNLVSFTAVSLGFDGNCGAIFQGNSGYDARDGRLIFDVSPIAGGQKLIQTDDRVVFNDLGPEATEHGVGDILTIAPSVPPAPVVEGRYCMNPAHIVYQCLTDPNCLGYPTAVMDAASFAAAADQLYAEGLGLNLKWTHQETIENFIGVVCDHAGMLLIKDRRTGLYKLRLLRDDYDIGDLKVFTPSNSRILSMQRPSPADIVNELQVTFKDYKTFKEATIPVRDTAAIQAMGRVVSKPHSLTGLPTQALAVRCGMRDLAAMSTPLWRIDLAFLRDADTLEPGEPFVLDYPASATLPDGLTLILRVADEINYGNAASGEISAKCVQDVFSLPVTGYTGTIDPVPEDSNDPVEAVATLLEAPYRDLVQLLPAADLSALPADAGYVGAAAVRPDAKHVGFELHTRLDPAPFALAGSGDFCGSALLLDALRPLDVNAYITESTDLDLLTVGSAAFLGEGADAEMVRIEGVSTGLLHLARGCGDTVPRAWPKGTRIWGYDNYAAADPTQYIDGETVEGKVLPRTGKGLLADATAMLLTIFKRAARPYPPADVRVAGAPVFDGNTTQADPPADPGTPTGEVVPAGASGSLPGGFVGVPYSNIGGLGDPWHDEGSYGYRYVTGDFWPGATVRHGGPINSAEWLNDVSGIPLTAGTYSVAARVETQGESFDHAQTVTIAAKPSYALLDFSGRTYAGRTHISGFDTASLSHAGIVDCAGWTSGKMYCEVNVTALGGLFVGVHAAALSNLYIGPGNSGTLGYEVGATGTYGVAFDTATGSLWVRNAAGWIGGGNPATGTAPLFTGLTTSMNGRFRFAVRADSQSTFTANFGNAAFAYAVPAGFAGVPMPAVDVPAIFDIQSLPIGTRMLITHDQAAGTSEVVGSLIADLDWAAWATSGKASGKWHFELTNPRLADDERVGLCVASFDRAAGMLGQAGTANSIGVRNTVLGSDFVKIEACLGGVHTEYLHTVAGAGLARVAVFTFAADLTAGTVAIYADGVLLRTISGVPAGTYYPAASGGFSGGSRLTTKGLAHPVATFSNWTETR